MGVEEFRASRFTVLAGKRRRDDTGLEAVLSFLFDAMLPFGVLLGGVALAVSAYRSVHYGWYGTLSLHGAMYGVAIVVLAFRRRLSGAFLFVMMLGLVSIDTLHSLFLFGLGGASLMNLAMICVFTGIFLGVRAGLLAAAVGVVVISSIGGGICAGWVHTLPNLETHLKSPLTWFSEVACLLLYVIPLVIATQGMKERLLASLEDLRRANRKMEREMGSRAEMEKKLLASEENYRRIFQNAVGGIFQITLQGRLINANPALARMAGYESVDEMTAEVDRFAEALFPHATDRARFRGRLEELGEVKGFETRLRRRDGSIIWALTNGRMVRDETGRAVCMEGTVEDIDQRKRAEIAVQESEAKYRSLVESRLFGFCIVQDRVFRFVNRQFCDITGYSAQELIGNMGILDLIHQDDRARVQGMLKDVPCEEAPRREFELKGIGKNGQVKTIRVSGTTLVFEGRPAVCGALLDVTNEKALKAQLMQAQKMEAIGTLTGGIAHDFNNILTALAGYGNMLQMQLKKEDPRRIYANQILSATAKASKLTQSLLVFGRKQPISLCPVNLNDAILGTEKLLRRLITEDIALVTQLTAENTTVFADPIQMDQILFNLATNAKDAMPKGGKFVLQTEYQELDEDFRRVHGFGEPGRFVLLSISDTGTGMDRETVSRVFDPFFTTKDVGKGTGLGLSTVYGIVKQHGGYITLYSEPGQGTSFHIYLPAISAAADEETKERPELCRGRETILIAEDDPLVSEMMRSVLRQFGYKTIHAADGGEAVRKFLEHDCIELAILDTVMPGKSGPEVSSELRKSNPDLKVILTSGYAMSILQDKGIGEGHEDFLHKPFSHQDLLTRVREVLDR